MTRDKTGQQDILIEECAGIGKLVLMVIIPLFAIMGMVAREQKHENYNLQQQIRKVADSNKDGQVTYREMGLSYFSGYEDTPVDINHFSNDELRRYLISHKK